jgi:hypothetical protein
MIKSSAAIAAVFFVGTSLAQAASADYAEGISRVRFDSTCNCLQFSEQKIYPNPAPATPFQGMTTGITYQGTACISTTDSADKYAISTARRNYHTGGTCGSEPTPSLSAPGNVCWYFNVSINKEDIQCDYHWLIKQKAAKKPK